MVALQARFSFLEELNACVEIGELLSASYGEEGVLEGVHTGSCVLDEGVVELDEISGLRGEVLVVNVLEERVTELMPKPMMGEGELSV